MSHRGFLIMMCCFGYVLVVMCANVEEGSGACVGLQISAFSALWIW